MLQVTYFNAQNELLVGGYRHDYEQLVSLTQQLFTLAPHQEVTLDVASTRGDTHVKRFVIRRGKAPNRVSYEADQIVFSISPTLVEQFLSFIQFPSDEDLPCSAIQYHHHYDGVGSDETYIAPDSLPVVFALRRNDEPAA